MNVGPRIVVTPTPRRAPAAPPPGDGRFTANEALGNFATGLANPLFSLIDGFKENPLKAGLLLAGSVVASAVVPLLLPAALTAIGLGVIAPFVIPALLLGLAVYVGFQGGAKILRGCREAYALYRQGRYDEAELRFQAVGEGAFEVASAVASAVQAVKGVTRAIVPRPVTPRRPRPKLDDR